MVTFSDYYKQRMAAAPPQQRPSSLPQYDFSGLDGLGKKIEESKPYGVLDTIIDVLSRPLYGVTNAVTGVSEGIADAREGNPAAAVGGIAAIPTNLLTGIFGTAGEEAKRTFSDVLEEQTDRHGKINDPNYRDTENNVDPVAKGVLGFIGDVALDPLTYVPGGLIAKGGKVLIQGGKNAVKGIEDTARGIRQGESAAKVADDAPAPKAVDEEDNVFADFEHAEVPGVPSRTSAAPEKPVAVADDAALADKSVAKWASESTIPEVQQAWAKYNIQLAKTSTKLSGDVKGTFLGGKIPDAEKELAKLYRRYNGKIAPVPKPAERTFTEMFREASEGPAAQGIRAELDNVLKMVSKDAPVEAKPTKSPGEWLAARQNRAAEPEDLDAAIALVPNVPEETVSKFWSAFGGAGKGIPYTYGRINELAGGSDDVAKLSRIVLKRMYENGAKVEASTEVTDALTAFNLRRAREEDAVRAGLGDDLFAFLEAKADSKAGAKAFEKIIRDLGRMADPSADVAVLDRINTTTRDAYTKALGLPKYIRSEVGPAEEAARIQDTLNAAQRPADEVLVRTFGEELPVGDGFKQKYTHREGATAFTEADREARLGRRVRQLNTMFQYDLNKRLFTAISKRMEDLTGKPIKEIAGLQRTTAYREAFYANWDALSRSLDGLGIKMHIGRQGQDYLSLTYRDIVELVEEGFDNSDTALAALFNYGTGVAPSRLMEAAHWAATSGARGDDAVAGIREILLNRKLTGYRGQVLDKKLDNNVLKSGTFASFPGKNQEKAARALAKSVPGARAVPNKNGGWLVKTGKDGLLEPMAAAIARAADSLVARAAENSAAYAARGMKESRSLTTTQLNRIRRVIEAGSMDEQVEALAKLRAKIQDEAADIGAFPSSVLAAEAAVTHAVGGFEVQRAKFLNQAMFDVTAKPVDRQKIVEASTAKQSESFGKEADDYDFEDIRVLDEGDNSAPARVEADEPDIELYDIAGMEPLWGVKEYAAQQGFVAGAAFGLRRVFDQSFGMKNLYGVFHAKRTVAGQVLSETVDQLRALKRYTPDQLTAAMAAVKSGVANSSPEVTQAAASISAVLAKTFDLDPSAKSLMNSPLLRTEPNIEHINAILRQKAGKETSFQLEDAESIADLAGQWRNWDFTDPITDLYKITDAFVTAAEHRSVVGNFLYEMGKVGHVSNVYKPGMVKIADSGGSTFASLIPEGTFMSKEMAKELHVLDAMVRTDRRFQGDLGDFFQKTYIPIQNIWKQLVTVFRAGHHVRNHLGNIFMSWIARGNSHYLSSYKDALRVMSLKNNYRGTDLLESLTAIGERMPKSSEVLVKGRHSFTADEVAKLAQDHGLMSSYATTEDLMLESASGRLGRLGADLSNSRVGRVAGGVSNFVDHHGKLQHFIQILKQESAQHGKWGKLSKAELVKRAVNEVKRAHPDSLMLTPTEAKWRFLIPFYTWFAKTLPFAMESAARNPGRLMVIPKASYNLAVAAGVNPASLSDPFPEDQLFPSFVTDGAFGPQFQIDGNYVNINPGVPQFDMLEQIFSPNPVEGVLGMTSPLLRVPAELATGSKIGGAPITDTSDYLDQNLPIVNYLANISGYSVTGSAVSVLQGKGLDPQAQVAKGNKTGFDQNLSVINWLTGLNAQNWSRPNFINYAEIEKRNRASQSDRSGF